MKNLFIFLLSFLISAIALAVPITGPDGEPALVNTEGQLFTLATQKSGSRVASEKGNAYLFPINFITLVAGAGEETVMFIQNSPSASGNRSQFAIGIVAIASTDPAAKFRGYYNVTADNTVVPGTPLEPLNLNASLLTPFSGTYKLLDGSNTAGPVGGILTSTGMGSFIFDTDEAALLGPGNSFTVTIESTPGAVIFGVIAGNY